MHSVIIFRQQGNTKPLLECTASIVKETNTTNPRMLFFLARRSEQDVSWRMLPWIYRNFISKCPSRAWKRVTDEINIRRLKINWGKQFHESEVKQLRTLNYLWVCEWLVVYVWPCDELMTRPGCHPALTLWQLPQPSSWKEWDWEQTEVTSTVMSR